MRARSKWHYDRPTWRATVLLTMVCIDLLAIVGVAGLATIRGDYAAQERLFSTAHDATSIRLQFGDIGEGAEVLISDPVELERFGELLRFERKGRCLCLHMDYIFFEAAAETTWADICGHCFDYHSGGKVDRFRMTRHLAKLFVSYAPRVEGDDRSHYWPQIR